MKKYLTVAIILLFIGLAFTPSIHANVSKEMVEFTTEVYGLNFGRQTVKITREEAEEVDALFKSIREQLNATKTRDKAEEIIKEAVVELDRYGLLGGLSIKQAQRLVTGGYQSSRIMKLIERYGRNKGALDDNKNWFCLVAGYTDCTGFTGLLSYILCFAMIERILIIHLIIRNLFPIQIGCIICLGGTGMFSWSDPGPAHGWLFTVGLNGIKKWDDKMEGDLPIPYLSLQQGLYGYLPGILGFTGINIGCGIIDTDIDNFYLGSALWVKME